MWDYEHLLQNNKKRKSRCDNGYIYMKMKMKTNELTELDEIDG